MRAILITVSMLTLLYGCESGNVRDTASTSVPADTRALALYNSGQYGQAASEYLDLARRYRADARGYRLAAADAYIQNQEIEQAEVIINELDPAEDGINESTYRKLLTARIELARNRPDLATSLLQQDIPNNLPGRLLASWYTTRAEIHESGGNEIDALLARIALENHLDDTALIEQNANRIWDHLERINLEEVSRALPRAPGNLRPWLELAALKQARFSQKVDLENAVKTWSAAYPDHPANQTILTGILTATVNLGSLPAHIALILPLTGVYENYSERIRDGFLSAWFSERSYKPVVRVYDADAASVSEVYLQAIQAGADFVVGPLQKEAVKVLSEMQPVPVRTLALNQIEPAQNIVAEDNEPSDDMPAFIQFGLPPEDEAREVAQRAILEGYTRVLIIAAADDFSNRVVNAFSEQWTSLGGRLLERIDFDRRTEDFIAPVKQLLNIDSSETRIALLRQRLGRSMNVNGRLRNDADFIFMVAQNLTARQIVPHLRFFRADTIPVYAISTVYDGIPAPLTDIDLDGVEFVDMPWLLNAGAERNQAAQAAWRPAGISLPRYYAFGIDAFRLISRLGDLALDRNNRYAGETGNLYLTDEGMVRRNLVWARFVNGQPQPIETGRQPR